MKQSADKDYARRIETEENRYYIGKFFSSLPIAVLLILVAAIFTFVVGLGVLIGHQKFLGHIQAPDVPIQIAMATVFGLISFIPGSAFSIAWSQFAARYTLVISHSATIGVCHPRLAMQGKTVALVYHIPDAETRLSERNAESHYRKTLILFITGIIFFADDYYSTVCPDWWM
jgi:hypothetical protein